MKRNRLLILLLLPLLPAATHTRAGDPPQEKKKISDKRDVYEEKVKAEVQQLEKKLATSPEEVITGLDGIIKTCIREGFNETLAHAYLLMGRAYKEIGQPNLALHFLDQAFVTFSALQSGRKIADANDAVPDIFFLHLAETQAMINNYDAAISNFKLYLSKQKDAEVIMKAQYALADVYYRAALYDDAIQVYNILLAEEQKRGNQGGVSACNARLAACYISKGQTKEGIEYYGNSIVDFNQVKTPDIEQLSKNKDIVSRALRSQEKYEEEVQVLKKGPGAETDPLNNLRMAQSFNATGDYRQAETALDKYFSATSYDLIDAGEIKVIKDIAVRLKDERKYQKATDYLLRYDALSDSINARLRQIEARAELLGVSGYQNLLQIEALQKDKSLAENMLAHYRREGELKAQVVSTQRYLIYILSLMVFLSIVAMIYISRVSKQRRLANQRLALRTLRSQMNPHFIFNALNSVNSFISVSDERSANKFLSDFSRLMRTVMENSEHDLIPLSKEIEIIKIYLELENFRFRDKFTFIIETAPGLDEEAYSLPPMLLQPYIENAIWHGLRYKTEKGELKVSISGDNENLYVAISDNGIGRAASQELKTKNQQRNKSTALRNISERIRIFNELHSMKIEARIVDLHSDKTGTVVKLKIPQAA